MPVFKDLKGEPFVADLSSKSELLNGIDVRDQAGFQKILEHKMRKKEIKASFILGGVTKYTVDMLHEGLTRCIFDGQAFDLEAVKQTFPEF